MRHDGFFLPVSAVLGEGPRTGPKRRHEEGGGAWPVVETKSYQAGGQLATGELGRGTALSSSGKKEQMSRQDSFGSFERIGLAVGVLAVTCWRQGANAARATTVWERLTVVGHWPTTRHTVRLKEPITPARLANEVSSCINTSQSAFYTPV